jgi:hypothetical protein
VDIGNRSVQCPTLYLNVIYPPRMPSRSHPIHHLISTAADREQMEDEMRFRSATQECSCSSRSPATCIYMPHLGLKDGWMDGWTSTPSLSTCERRARDLGAPMPPTTGTGPGAGASLPMAVVNSYQACCCCRCCCCCCCYCALSMRLACLLARTRPPHLLAI